MKRICLSFIIIILCLIPGMALQSELNQNIKNESSLQFSKEDKEIDGATSCHGTVDSGTLKELNEIGIKKEDLEKKVYCTVGDFDGNGYLDFAIWGGNKNKNKWPDYENYLVLFYEKDRKIKIIKIKSDFRGELFVHYPPRSKIGPNGEPISSNDALWLIGQSGDYDDVSKGIVYIFNSKLGVFNKVEFGNKNEKKK